jgi:hypothetical protein
MIDNKCPAQAVRRARIQAGYCRSADVFSAIWEDQPAPADQLEVCGEPNFQLGLVLWYESFFVGQH